MRTESESALVPQEGAGSDSDPRRTLRVRSAREDDAPAVVALLRALGYSPDDGRAPGEILRATLDRPDLAAFLAVGDVGPLGLIVVSHRPQLHLGGTLVSIDALAVLPEVRGRGIGRRLLRRAAAYARLHRAVRLELHTTRARENYRRGFYPANGFREIDSALFRRDLVPIATEYGPRAASLRDDGEEGG